MAQAVLEGGKVLDQLFTASGAITIGSPVYRTAADTIATASDTNDATTEAKPVFGIFNGTNQGGDAASGDTDCSVAIGPCQVNAGGAITAGQEVTAKYSATAGVTLVQSGVTPGSGDVVIGTAIGDGASGGKVAINVTPRTAA